MPDELELIDAYWRAAKLDERRNQAATGDAEIGAPGAPVATVVIAAREDLEIARQVRHLLAAP